MIVDLPDSLSPNEVVLKIQTAGGEIVSVIPRRKRLEDLFLEAVGKDNKAKGRQLKSMVGSTEEAAS
jgi:ABC-2 type transport system ATP-binding protein